MSRDIRHEDIEQFVQESAGKRLPGEREMTVQFGISRVRLRSILEGLERQGLVQRRHGSGTYALARREGNLRRVILLVDSSLKLGDDPFFSLLVERLQGELQRVAAECVIQRTHGNGTLLPESDGVIALGAAGLRSLSTDLLSSQPAVGLFAPSTNRPGRRVSLLKLEDEIAGKDVAVRLLREGVRHVYFFGRCGIPAVQERLTGVQQELKGAGIPLDVLECGLNYSAGLEQGCRFTPSSPELIGVIAANDWLAIGLHTGLQAQDGDLRRRIRMISFDGLAVTRRPELGIASLVVPLETMAVDTLAELQRLKRPGAVGRSIRYPLAWSTDFSDGGESFPADALTDHTERYDSV